MLKKTIEEDSLSMIPQTHDDAPFTPEEMHKIFDDDMATVHTADENPAISIPITDKNIHAFNYSIIIKGGNDYNLKINKISLKYNTQRKLINQMLKHIYLSFSRKILNPINSMVSTLRPKNWK